MKLSRLEMEHAQLVLEMYTVRSPVAGVVSRIHKSTGEAARRFETLLEIQVPDRE